LFGKRKLAEADAQSARSEATQLHGQLTELQAQYVALTSEKVAAERELERVRGLDFIQLTAEVDRARGELADLRAQIAQTQAAEMIDATERHQQLLTTLDAARKRAEHAALEVTVRRDILNREAADAEQRLQAAHQGIVITDDVAMLQEAGIYSYKHILADAVAYKSKLDLLTDEMKTTVKNGHAVSGKTNWTVNGSQVQGRKMVKDFSKLMLRAYNAEADYAVRSMRPHRLHSLTDRLEKSRNVIAQLGATMDIRITDHYHRLRTRELELTADFLAKQDEEKERRRELREMQREEEKLQREIERERARLAKEREQYLGALARLRASGSIVDEVGIGDLEAKLSEVDTALAAVDAREANIRAGYVYVISNIGAFGKSVVKIGLTRRLEPMDRVNELGDASVPFRFDVHALIFSEDAVGLERRLHKEFESRRVNRVNLRREFFHASPTEVREALARFGGQHLLEFHEDADALEWRASTAESPEPSSH
jgi:Domain of unknown function (DUF4041)/Meiotically up-regulated gene 113